MKKLISIITTFALTSSAALPLIAFSQDNSLTIAFVPSKDSIRVMNIVKPLESLLKNKIKELYPEFNRNVKITTTTSYESAGQALQDGKTALAFLPMGTYVESRGKEITPGNYADAAPLVIVERNAMKPEFKEDNTMMERVIDPKQLKQILNVGATYNSLSKGITSQQNAYNKLYFKTNDQKFTSFYRAEIIANNDFLLREKNKCTNPVDIDNLFVDENNYNRRIKQLIEDAIAEGTNKIQLLSSSTSGAGVIYPVKWMLDNGVDRKVVGNILRKQSRVESFTAAAQNVATGACCITFGYTDFRAEAPQVERSYKNTKMIGLTDGILNDGISYSKKAIKDQKLLVAIRKAFKSLVEDPKNHEIFNVYTHTNYIIPDKDATPEQLLEWEVTQNNSYNQALVAVQEATNLIKSIH